MPFQKPFFYQKLCQLDAQDLGYGILIELGANNAKTTDNSCAAKSYVGLTGNIVEMDPFAVIACNDSLCAENHTVLLGIGKALKSRAKRIGIELLGGFGTKAYKHLVSVVMVVVVMMTAGAIAMLVIFVMMMLMLVIVAVAFLIVIVMVVMLVLLVIVAMAFLIVIVVMVMLMLMIVAVAFLIVFVMVVMLMLVIVAMAVFAVFVMVVMLVLLVIVVAALSVVMVMLVLFMIVVAALSVMVMMLVSLLGKLAHFRLKGGFSFHSFEQLCAGQLLPRSGNDYRSSIVLLKKCNAIGYLLVGHLACVAEYDTAGILNLIVEKFAEVLHVHFALVGVNYGGEAVKLSTFGVGILNCLDDVGKLTYARGLDKNTVGSKLSDNLLERLGKVANKGATNAARVHFVDLNACLGKKAAIDTDLTKFVFYKNNFFAMISLFNKLFNKCGLSRTEKARENVNFSHLYLPSFK